MLSGCGITRVDSPSEYNNLDCLLTVLCTISQIVQIVFCTCSCTCVCTFVTSTWLVMGWALELNSKNGVLKSWATSIKREELREVEGVC